jgi:hypothetical protein
MELAINPFLHHNHSVAAERRLTVSLGKSPAARPSPAPFADLALDAGIFGIHLHKPLRVIRVHTAELRPQR